MICPLCRFADNKIFLSKVLHKALNKKYYQCSCCDLIYLDKANYISPVEEKKRYDSHQNVPSDNAYRNFLKQVTDPLTEILPDNAKGLDYGSGPGPAISVMYAEQGIEVFNYDPFFAPDNSVLNKRYDFITCTEAAEHFHSPGREFDRLASIVKVNGIIAVMTNIFDSDKMEFESWWYPKDPTHVCFYSITTFEWMAKHYGWRLNRQSDNVVFFRNEGLS